MEHLDHKNGDSWRIKGARFVRYVTTRHPEVWGFFAAGFIAAKIL